jgi:hypothetical protein
MMILKTIETQLSDMDTDQSHKTDDLCNSGENGVSSEAQFTPPIVKSTEPDVEVNLDDVDSVFDLITKVNQLEEDLKDPRTASKETHDLLKHYSDLLREEIGQGTYKDVANNHSLRINLWSDAPEVDAVVDHVFDQIKELLGGIGQERKTKTCLKMILLNLLQAHSLSELRWVRYSRDDRYYGKNNRKYNPLGVGRATVTLIMDALPQLGYTDYCEAFRRFTGSSNEGRQSLVRATDQLISLLQDTFHLHAGMISVFRHLDPLRVKNEEGIYLDYTENRETKRLRDHIKRYNALIADANISLKDNADVDHLKSLRPVDVTRTRYSRTYRSTKFDEGGRFYGPWWQNMKRQLRPSLLINGKETVELDYGAMFVHLAYSMEGVSYWDSNNSDPYDLPSMPDLDRRISKLVLLFSFNNNTETRLIRAVNSKLREEGINKGDVDLKAVLQAHRKKHSAIETMILSECGNELMTLEGKVSEYVIERMTKAEIVALNVHDSFVVEEVHKETLFQSMLDAFLELDLISVPNIGEK